MKRKSKFGIFMLSALLTFGTLMATIGPRHFKHAKHYMQQPHCNKQQAIEK